MRRPALIWKPPKGEPDWSAEAAQRALDANNADLDREEDRMKTIDGKLTQLAAFSGLSISISASLGANAVVSHKLRLGFEIALGATLSGAILLLFVAIVVCFRNLSPKLYRGAQLKAVGMRTDPTQLRKPEADVLTSMAMGRRDTLRTARKVNRRKAVGTVRAFRFAQAGFGLLALSLIVAVVGALL